jgi:hypothetical protein
MATYVFNVDSIEVHNQKASTDHSDSDWLTLAATVANINTKSVGTVFSGTFHIGISSIPETPLQVRSQLIR